MRGTGKRLNKRERGALIKLVAKDSGDGKEKRGANRGPRRTVLPGELEGKIEGEVMKIEAVVGAKGISHLTIRGGRRLNLSELVRVAQIYNTYGQEDGPLDHAARLYAKAANLEASAKDLRERADREVERVAKLGSPSANAPSSREAEDPPATR